MNESTSSVNKKLLSQHPKLQELNDDLLNIF